MLVEDKKKDAARLQRQEGKTVSFSFFPLFAVFLAIAFSGFFLLFQQSPVKRVCFPLIWIIRLRRNAESVTFFLSVFLAFHASESFEDAPRGPHVALVGGVHFLPFLSR